MSGNHIWDAFQIKISSLTFLRHQSSILCAIASYRVSVNNCKYGAINFESILNDIFRTIGASNKFFQLDFNLISKIPIVTQN
jgi:hypothetical protein